MYVYIYYKYLYIYIIHNDAFRTQPSEGDLILKTFIGCQLRHLYGELDQNKLNYGYLANVS